MESQSSEKSKERVNGAIKKKVRTIRLQGGTSQCQRGSREHTRVAAGNITPGKGVPNIQRERHRQKRGIMEK